MKTATARYAKVGLSRLLIQKLVLTYSGFLIIIIAFGIFMFQAEKTRVHSEMKSELEREKAEMVARIQEHQTTLDVLRNYMEGLLEEGKLDGNPNELKNLMSSLISKYDFQYDIYFALEPKYAQLLFKKNDVIYLVNKEITELGRPQYQDPRYFAHKVFHGANYSDDPKALWYQQVRHSSGIRFTDIYYDADYIKMQMVSVTLALHDKDGRFAGVVGLDIPAEVTAFKSLQKMGSYKTRSLIFNQDGKSVESLQKMFKPKESDPGYSPEYGLDLTKINFKTREGIQSLNDGTGRNLYVMTAEMQPGKWYIASFRYEDLAFAPIYRLIFTLLGASTLVFVALLVYSFGVGRRMVGSMDRLLDNFRYNSQVLKESRDEFPYVKPLPMRIHEFDELRQHWDGFLAALKDSLNEAHNAREKSEKALQLQSIFLANMSHEIRTPMNAIIGMAEILAETNLDEDQQKYLKVFKASSDNLLGLINDVLDIAKIEADSMVVEKIEMNLRKIKEDTHLIFAHKAKHKGLKYSFEIENGLNPYVMGDPLRIKQVIFNLVSNAIKFTESGFIDIYIHTSDRPGYYQIRVKDSGIGISKAVQGQLFQKFSQADASTTRKFGGTGLGLSIVRSLCRIMGGDVTVESEPGIGACFKADLPLENWNPDKLVDAVKGSEPKPALTLVQGTRLRVLVADDVKENRFVMSLFLKSLGHDFDLAENGEEACKLYDAKKYDIVFMDIQMPVLDGVGALKKIRLIQREGKLDPVPVYALTAFASSEDQEKYLREGFDGFVTKPLKKDVLKRTIDEALGSHPAMQKAELVLSEVTSTDSTASTDTSSFAK